MRISPVSVVRNNQQNSDTNITSGFMNVSKVNSLLGFGTKYRFQEGTLVWGNDNDLFELAKKYMVMNIA